MLLKNLSVNKHNIYGLLIPQENHYLIDKELDVDLNSLIVIGLPKSDESANSYFLLVSGQT